MPLCDILLNTLPRYETKIPSTKEEVWFRPLLVKEERLLLQISEFGTYKEKINCIIRILESCFEYDNINYPHYLRPNTSPWTSVAPTILFHKNKPWMTLGTPGSDRIPTITAQFISSMIDSGLSPNDAMNRPRIHCTVDGIVANTRK